MTREQIAAACQRAGLPPPIFEGDIATIRVMVGPDIPKISNKQFDRWCRKVGHAGVARFINAQIGTNYDLDSIYKMRRLGRPVSAKIRQLVWNTPGGPIDPNPGRKNRELQTRRHRHGSQGASPMKVMPVSKRQGAYTAGRTRQEYLDHSHITISAQGAGAGADRRVLQARIGAAAAAQGVRGQWRRHRARPERAAQSPPDHGRGRRRHLPGMRAADPLDSLVHARRCKPRLRRPGLHRRNSLRSRSKCLTI